MNIEVIKIKNNADLKTIREGLTKEKKELLKDLMGSASSKIDFNKVRDEWKYSRFTNKIILDPSRDGCTIWFVGRNTIKTIKGNPSEICSKIHKFVTFINDEDKTVQHIEIALDAMGLGMDYRYYFDTMHLKYDIIKPEKELKI